MKSITKNFGKGLLVLVPLIATIYAIIKLFTFIDGLLRGILPFNIPGFGFLATLVIIITVGYLASSVLFRWFFDLIDRLFARLPLLKIFYSSIKDLIGAFVGDKKSFDKPVAVTLIPGGAAKVIGFVTRESLKNFGLEDYVAVYLPQSFNFAGNLFLFPKDQVERLKADSSDVMAFVMSGGVTAGGEKK
ncbi:MAG: DUF502 domain-containing protein [Candidatus Omnitrophota bacterium]